MNSICTCGASATDCLGAIPREWFADTGVNGVQVPLVAADMKVTEVAWRPLPGCLRKEELVRRFRVPQVAWVLSGGLAAALLVLAVREIAVYGEAQFFHDGD